MKITWQVDDGYAGGSRPKVTIIDDDELAEYDYMDILTQVIIFIFGVSAIFMSQSDHPKLQKWACIFGLVSQPAWFYTSYIHHQWGVFIMSFFYTAAWGRGILTYWLNSREIVSD